MKPPRFEYFDPQTIEEAVALLAAHGEDAKVLAGGQSLIPMLNFRVARPQVVVDVNGIAALSYVRERDGTLGVGTLLRQREAEASLVLRERCPLLAAAIPFVGHAAIRNRGTVGGSVAHADPAAELPVVVTALDGTLVVRGPGGERAIAARDFFVSYLTTSLAPDEMLVEVRLPCLPAAAGVAFHEVSRRDGDGRCAHAALALGGVGPVPFSAAEEAALMLAARPDEAMVREVARRVAARIEPDADLHASREYRREVGGVLVRRALTEAIVKARGDRA